MKMLKVTSFTDESVIYIRVATIAYVGKPAGKKFTEIATNIPNQSESGRWGTLCYHVTESPADIVGMVEEIELNDR